MWVFLWGSEKLSKVLLNLKTHMFLFSSQFLLEVTSQPPGTDSEALAPESTPKMQHRMKPHCGGRSTGGKIQSSYSKMSPNLSPRWMPRSHVYFCVLYHCRPRTSYNSFCPSSPLPLPCMCFGLLSSSFISLVIWSIFHLSKTTKL